MPVTPEFPPWGSIKDYLILSYLQACPDFLPNYFLIGTKKNLIANNIPTWRRTCKMFQTHFISADEESTRSTFKAKNHKNKISIKLRFLNEELFFGWLERSVILFSKRAYRDEKSSKGAHHKSPVQCNLIKLLIIIIPCLLSCRPRLGQSEPGRLDVHRVLRDPQKLGHPPVSCPLPGPGWLASGAQHGDDGHW